MQGSDRSRKYGGSTLKSRKVTVEVPEYTANGGLLTSFESSFNVKVEVMSDGSVLIKGNATGLQALARHLLTLAQSDEVPDGTHIHYDAFLHDGSCELVIERDDEVE